MSILFRRNNKSSFTLISALGLMVIIMMLGSAAMVVSRLGFSSSSSNYSYTKAKNAADYGLHEAFYTVKTQKQCEYYAAATSLSDSSQYSFNMTKDAANNACFIRSIGTFKSAKVIKTAIIAIYGGVEFGALTTIGNTVINITGSGSIANCDPTCIGPAVAYGGSLTGQFTTSTTCQNNNKGIVGNPATKSTDNNDKTSLYFESANYSELMTDLAINVDSNGNVLAPTGYLGWSSGCYDNRTGATCTTANGNVINCAKSGTTVSIDLDSCTNAYIASNLTIDDDIAQTSLKNLYVSGNISINGNNIDISNLSMYSNAFSINGNGGTIAGGIIYSGGNVSVSVGGNYSFGTAANPTMLIVEDDVLLGGNGTVDFYGLLFTYGININVTGDYTFHGSIVMNDTSTLNASLTLGGNSSINFDNSIIGGLHSKYPSLAKQLSCSQDPDINSGKSQTAVMQF